MTTGKGQEHELVSFTDGSLWWRPNFGRNWCRSILFSKGSGKITMGIGLVEVAILVCGGGLLLVAVVAGIYFWQQREK